ncbi:NosD domain-containing protein [Paenibacillus sp. CGMCC 1.18879]|uniref:NosD domain-containing protein n=1 Tax=Paenibacillus sp. CGMCC 1.18879 TaxID=2834466 RepID=UPI001CA960CC|nr:NosD domain-containing protein [Paenibacillus sp. CGMCC 1.18879]MBY9079788.1 right-handed parallel beta-helix repeat-containing protein [Paenibacillus sp. CGMCC 1.18879]
MASKNYYDVTEWPVGNPYEDIGEVINSIIADIKSRQSDTDVNKGGKPGAVIYIPPGDYHLGSQVVIDISYLKIMGSGHGFTSSSIRFNTSENEWADLHELWPGGSRILVDIPLEVNDEEYKGAAFYVERSGNPRISSVEFSDFCIDGLHYIENGSGETNPENTYTNGKTGIYVASACDSFRITGMGFVYLEHGITIYHADALTIHDNFIAECGNCIELRGWGQASKITDNLIGAGFKGYSIFAQNFGGLLITANNVFPRGASCIYFNGVTRSSITNNRLHSFYPGMVVFRANCSENLVSSNHFLRDHEPWTPFLGIDNGLDDLYGLLNISGNNNSVIANHFSEVINTQNIKPVGATPVIIRIVSGNGNYISNNHVVATEVHAKVSDSCFSAQVDALLTTEASKPLTVTTVIVEKESVQNTILDSGRDAQVVMDKTVNAFRVTPTPGA